MCAEGGTGYYHPVTLARAERPEGPYVPAPMNPILTSVPENHNELRDTDHLKPRYYNPEAPLQKAGHGSLVETPDGTPFLAFHISRPFVPELCCTLGRETGIRKMQWTPDGWLQIFGGGNMVRAESEESGLPLFDPKTFTDLASRPGWLRMRGQQSLSSLYKASLLARPLTGIHAEAVTKLDFEPEVYEHSAYGEFTGTMVGLGVVDAMFHAKCADFDFFTYKNEMM